MQSQAKRPGYVSNWNYVLVSPQTELRVPGKQRTLFENFLVRSRPFSRPTNYINGFDKVWVVFVLSV